MGKQSEETKQILNSWLYNVKDEFKPLSKTEIVDVLRKTCFPAAIACEHWLGDFNMSTALRNANGFNLKEMFYIGKRHWHRTGSVGTHHYTKLTHFENTAEFIKHVYKDYVLIGIDNIPGVSVDMREFRWPSNALMIFGEEGVGLTKDMLECCEYVVEIPMFGSVRSLNCGTSSGITIYDYVKKHTVTHGV